MTSFDLYTITILTIATAGAGVLGFAIGSYVVARRKDAEVPLQREDAARKSRASLGGQVLEKLSPHLPNFPYDPTELRYIGDPVDYLVFSGLRTGTIDELVFLEVKSGTSGLRPIQRSIRDAVDAKRIRWDLYRVPSAVTPASAPTGGS